MGWFKRILGMGEIAVGAVTGQPGLAAKGGGDIITSGGKPQQPGQVFPGVSSAASFEANRAQRRDRMDSKFGIGGG